MIDKEAFFTHLAETKKVVETWPEWKKTAMIFHDSPSWKSNQKQEKHPPKPKK